MSENDPATKSEQAEERTRETRSFVRTVRRATRRRYAPEEKIRIVLEGFRREMTVNDLCRREGIKPANYYSWTKEFMEAGKERLARNTVRDATRHEIEQLKRENRELKEIVAELLLETRRLKKNGAATNGGPVRQRHMSTVEKAEILEKVSASPAPTRQVLQGLGVPKSTYYRWRARSRSPNRPRGSPGRRIPWNRLAGDEERTVLRVARSSPEWSSPDCIGAWITDHQGFSVSEATVFRILKREGLVRRLEIRKPAGKEYTNKTAAPHRLWATDASYFRVIGWGYYYLVTVMDDFSRFILAWKLQIDMTAASLIDVVQDAVDVTGMTDVPVEDRTRVLSDNGPGYVSRSFREYLQLVGIRHILAAPFHPQTNGKLKRYHQTLKRGVNQIPYDVPKDLEAAISDFVSYYNFRRYHKALGDVTPADVLAGRREEILRRRKEVKTRTIERRRQINRALRERLTPA